MVLPATMASSMPVSAVISAEMGWAGSRRPWNASPIS
jgi:hypothetical protein